MQSLTVYQQQIDRRLLTASVASNVISHNLITTICSQLRHILQFQHVPSQHKTNNFLQLHSTTITIITTAGNILQTLKFNITFHNNEIKNKTLTLFCGGEIFRVRHFGCISL